MRKKPLCKIIMILCLICLYVKFDLMQKEVLMENYANHHFSQKMISQYVPFFHYGIASLKEISTKSFLAGVLGEQYPVFGNEIQNQMVTAAAYQLAENTKEEKTWQENDVIQQQETEKITSENDSKDELYIKMKMENEQVKDLKIEPKETVRKADAEKQENTQNLLMTLLKNQEKRQVISWDTLEQSDKLIEKYYTVDPSTQADAGQINIYSLSEKNMKIEKREEPQILIYHTHSQETFCDSIPGDANTSIVGVGEFLAQILREQYGYQVIHHCGCYDIESRDMAYARVAPALEEILKENPSIEVVIDLHRDAVADGRKLVSNVNGIDVARFMFFNGLSYTKERGKIEYLENPYIEDNLAFSFQMETTAESYYPGITRKIYLKGYRYNMNYCPKSLLIELGAQTNTVQEMMNSCIPLAHVLDLVLSGEAEGPDQ